MVERTSLSETAETTHANLFPESEPKVVRLALSAGERVDPHTHPNRQVVIHLLEGRLELDLDDETYGLHTGDVIRFDGRREVSPKAVTESRALVVLARGD